MNIMAKMPALDVLEAEIIRLETRVKTLMARRDKVHEWMWQDYAGRKDRAGLAVARIEGAFRASSRGARALHKVYMQILHD